uniref:Transcription cofactor vestigial-like protein 1 isoform X1 n=1 Tax=Phascolarctos cinereus TaxID=38626 RepID=A0A6P5J8M0_PHACI|nr:transcription cofactor vestigial-like protein 1 isoform X1 [Phascolarctos cinereus]XP_020827432.1 transcription cofactor vestigial-like protein 1 isoform X1 [Phascolarctos cinereus]XP_020827434.1 transcription cofactor vestigial-like protein 1 isoform X1 [Phascolarctos cinereus]
MSAKMDEMKKSSLRLTRDKQQPIKTEWSSQYVLFTYFHGDINSVVDEHFSRALSNTKKPKELSTQDRSEAASPTSDNQLHPGQWSFNSHCSKPHQELSPVNNGLANCALNVSVAQDSSPLMVASPSPQLGELWHLSSSVASPSPAEPGYPPSFPSFHLMPGTERERKYGSLLNLLQQDGCLVDPTPPARKQARHSPLGTGAPNMHPTGSPSPDGGNKSGSFQSLENTSTNLGNENIETNAVSPPKSDSPGCPGEVKGLK